MIKNFINETAYFLRTNVHYAVIIFIAAVTGILIAGSSLIEQDQILLELRKENIGQIAPYYEFENYAEQRKTLRAAYHRHPLEEREELKDDFKKYILYPDTID